MMKASSPGLQLRVEMSQADGSFTDWLGEGLLKVSSLIKKKG